MNKGQGSQLLAILLLLLLIVGVLVFVLPMRDKVAALRADKDVASIELEQLQSDFVALEDLSSEISKSSATKDALIDSVPVGATQDELILEVSEMAAEYGFDLNAMNFSDTVDQDYGKVMTVSANYTGSYDDLISLLQGIESADRLLRVTSISVQLTSTTEVVFNLNLEAYYQ